MAWCRTKDKPCLNQCWPSSPTHICGTSGRKVISIYSWRWITRNKCARCSSPHIIKIINKNIIFSLWIFTVPDLCTYLWLCSSLPLCPSIWHGNTNMCISNNSAIIQIRWCLCTGRTHDMTVESNYAIFVCWVLSYDMIKSIKGLEQEGGSLIAPIVLAHPLHPIDNRSKNRRRNLWVGWCVPSWWPLFPSRCSVSIYIYIHIYIYALLYEFCFLWFTNCGLLSDDNSLIPRCLWLLTFVLNNTLILGIWCSTTPHLPGCFCPWTFFQNIGFNMVPSDPFMSHLATQFGYSAGEFQALQLILLATCGVVD